MAHLLLLVAMAIKWLTVSESEFQRSCSLWNHQEEHSLLKFPSVPPDLKEFTEKLPRHLSYIQMKAKALQCDRAESVPLERKIYI